MNNSRMRYIYHLDDLRKKKNISIKQICDGICSDRQYRKYLSGINNISDQRIMEFCEKLGISARDYYYSLNEKDNYNHSKIKNIYSKLTAGNLKETSVLLEEFTRNTPLTNQNERFLNYCKLRYKYDSNRNNAENVLKEINHNVNYPNCDKTDAFDFVDILFLLLIAQIEITQDKEQALNMLLSILKNPDLLYLSSENRNIIPTIYSNVAIMLGRLNKLEECILIAKQGVNYCLKYSYNKSLTRLYYSLSLSHKKLDHPFDAEYYSSLCITSAISRNNKNEINHFYKLLEDDFKKDPFILLLQNKTHLLKNESKS